MKKLSYIFLLLWVMVPGIYNSSMAQNNDLSDPIPFEPNTKVGTLENGMKYYIRQNAKPENFAELRLALNAGSLLETDEQQGLAHFVEHMCFNGTESFPKSALVDYLESIGTKFGAHLNAYTSFDETVYMLRVPTDDQEKFAKGMMILEEWAHKVSFEGEEIDKERGVVVEEWRTRLGANDRMMQETLPKTFYGSKYAERLPIGKKEILETFPHKELTQFYKDWYRPDLMAIVAVGDFDVDQVEKMIKERFGKIKPVENPKERPVFEIPDHDETFISIVTDEEARFNRVSLQYKHDARTYKTLEDYRVSILENLTLALINGRLGELRQSENAPFNFAFAGYSGMARAKDNYSAVAIVSEDGFLKGLEALLTEQQRAIKYGFTETELERAKKSLMAGIEKQYNERDKTPSNRVVMSYVYHFLSEVPVEGVENTLKLYKEYLPGINLEEVNGEFRRYIRDESRVVNLSGVQKEGMTIPTEAEVQKLLDEISAKEIEAYEDETSDLPFLAEKPAPGNVTDTKFIESINVTELTLSNGVKVVLKPTDFKNDEINLSAYSPGGTSLYSDEEYLTANMADRIVAQSGLGNYNNIELQKYMSDKVAFASPYIAELREGFSGSASPKDLETMFQMIYLYFTQPRKDEKAFNSMMTQTKSLNANALASPEAYFRSEVYKVMNNDHPRRQALPSNEDLDKVKLDRAYEIFKERFADASDFTFLLVGNFEVDKIKPMLETYLGSLPSINREENWKDIGVKKAEGVIEKTYYKGKEPKSQVQLKWGGDFGYKGKNRYQLNSMVQVLRIMLRESMREDKGGVYGVGARAGASRIPQERYSIDISFTCSPDNVDELIETAMKDIKDLQENGPSEKNMQKIKETQRKDIETNIKSNRAWMSGLRRSYQNGSNPEAILDQAKPIDKLKAKQIQKAAKKYFDMDNFARFVLKPESEDKSKTR